MPTARPTPSPRIGRAKPLPPDERRAALVAATLPLVLAHGTDLTTRAIADASGVAEGTIFRVFPDKEALIRATVEAALDPGPVIAELSAVDPALPLDQRVTELASIMQRRLSQVIGLLIALGPPPDAAAASRLRRDRNAEIQRTIAATLAPDRDRLRCPPEEVARLIRVVTFAGTHPLINEGHPLSPTQIADLVLNGVRNDD